MSVTRTPEAPVARGPRVPPALVAGLAYAVLLVAGLLLGLVESFTFSWAVVVAPLYCVVNAALMWAAGFGMGGKLGAIVPALGWAVVTVILSVKTAEGSLIVTGTTAGYIYAWGGMAAAVVAVALAPWGRNWMLTGVPRDRP